jgi:hypothetical protein
MERSKPGVQRQRCCEIAMPHTFPRPWSVEELDGCIGLIATETEYLKGSICT